MLFIFTIDIRVESLYAHNGKLQLNAVISCISDCSRWELLMQT